MPKISCVDRENMIKIGSTYRCPGRDPPAFPVLGSNHHSSIPLVWHLAESGRKAEVWRYLAMSVIQ